MLWLVLASVIVGGALVLFAAWKLFQRGMADQRLADAPYLLLACFTVLPPLVGWLRQWQDSESGMPDVSEPLVYGAALYAVGAAIWATGHVFGGIRRDETFH